MSHRLRDRPGSGHCRAVVAEGPADVARASDGWRGRSGELTTSVLYMLVVLTLLRHLLAYSPTGLAGKGEISVLPGTTSIVVHCTVLTTNAAFAVLRVGCVLARVAAPGNADPSRPMSAGVRIRFSGESRCADGVRACPWVRPSGCTRVRTHGGQLQVRARYAVFGTHTGERHRLGRGTIGR
jgi:hypothetical protein